MKPGGTPLYFRHKETKDRGQGIQQDLIWNKQMNKLKNDFKRDDMENSFFQWPDE